MTLPIIRSRGIEAYCADLVLDENTWAYLLSVAGYQVAVKAIIANVLEYKTVTVALNDRLLNANRAAESYSVHYQKLPSGLFQGTILPKIALPNYEESKDLFLILAEILHRQKGCFSIIWRKRQRYPCTGHGRIGCGERSRRKAG